MQTNHSKVHVTDLIRGQQTVIPSHCNGCAARLRFRSTTLNQRTKRVEKAPSVHIQTGKGQVWRNAGRRCFDTLVSTCSRSDAFPSFSETIIRSNKGRRAAESPPVSRSAESGSLSGKLVCSVAYLADRLQSMMKAGRCQRSSSSRGASRISPPAGRDLHPARAAEMQQSHRQKTATGARRSAPAAVCRAPASHTPLQVFGLNYEKGKLCVLEGVCRCLTSSFSQRFISAADAGELNTVRPTKTRSRRPDCGREDEKTAPRQNTAGPSTPSEPVPARCEGYIFAVISPQTQGDSLVQLRKDRGRASRGEKAPILGPAGPRPWAGPCERGVATTSHKTLGSSISHTGYRGRRFSGFC
ncbi:hypothetical protein MHYP_G00009570 [Metynnis hypsauchen]